MSWQQTKSQYGVIFPCASSPSPGFRVQVLGWHKLYHQWHKLYHHLSPRKWEMMIGPLRNTRIVLSTEWPEGKFCILENGRCPRGFRRHERHLKSLYLYSSHSHSHSQFVNSAKFGSSSIGCYGTVDNTAISLALSLWSHVANRRSMT